tara:strand:- start:970 stop:1134 length:165 start_codon:yes stop_codon:yes gene_type:complete
MGQRLNLMLDDRTSELMDRLIEKDVGLTKTEVIRNSVRLTNVLYDEYVKSGEIK